MISYLLAWRREDKALDLPQMKIRVLSLSLVSALAFAMLGGCSWISDGGPLDVVVIDKEVKMTNPDNGRPGPASQSLLSATAQGLVSYDSVGQIEPGLALSWMVTDDGLSYIFRIQDAEWADGSKVTTRQVVQLMRPRLQRKTRNRYAPELSDIESIRAMTAQVIEIRLRRPAPYLLDILAQPDMALLMKGRGWGPMAAKTESGGLTLTHKPDPLADEDDYITDPEPPVQLMARPASRAVARYVNDESDVLLGGKMQDFPLFAASGIDERRLVVDPAEGIFGLVFTHDDGILRYRDVREAISMAIIRTPIVQAFGEASWTPSNAVRLPLEKQDALFAPYNPEFSAMTIEDRVTRARNVITERTKGLQTKPKLRIALPDGPGSDLLFGYLRGYLQRVGLDSVQVGINDKADLRLVDEVAPSRDPLWYLRRFSCRHGNVCNSQADGFTEAASRADTLADKAQNIRQAELLLTQTAGYIPLAQPLRWSVTHPRSRGLRPNARARHPLNRLFGDTT